MNGEQHDLQIGVASVDITPPAGATMVGYQARKSNAVGLRLGAQALVCSGASGSWALVTSDTIGYTYGYARRIREAIAEATGIPAEAVILSGTHTHSGPSTIVFGRGEDLDTLDREYLDALHGKLVQLVTTAQANAAPGSFETAWTEAPDVGHNRRIRKSDGTWGNEWEDPEGRHTGYFDPAILLVAVRRPDGRCDALLVNFGCHPVVLGPKSLVLSGDYVGYMRRYLENEAGCGIPLFALAACGNINPRVCVGTDTGEAERMGKTVARIVMDAIPRLSPVDPGPVAVCSVPWEFQRTRENPKRKGNAGYNREDIVRTEIVAARAGELGIIATPGELFSEFNKPLREASPTGDTVVVTLAHDYIGYIPTDRAQEEGAYETTMAPATNLEQPFLEHAQRAFAGC